MVREYIVPRVVTAGTSSGAGKTAVATGVMGVLAERSLSGDNRLQPRSRLGLPDGLDGFYIGGGFPEMYSASLEGNAAMRKSMKETLEDGLPTFAECGGLLYLTNSITDFVEPVAGRSQPLDPPAYRLVGPPHERLKSPRCSPQTV